MYLCCREVEVLLGIWSPSQLDLPGRRTLQRSRSSAHSQPRHAFQLVPR